MQDVGISLLSSFLNVIIISKEEQSNYTSSKKCSLAELEKLAQGSFPAVSLVTDPNWLQYDIENRKVQAPFCKWREKYIEYCCVGGACPNETRVSSYNEPYEYCIFTET